MSDDPVAALRLGLPEFARERDWEQFHNPKNLAMALAGEVGELPLPRWCRVRCRSWAASGPLKSTGQG